MIQATRERRRLVQLQVRHSGLSRRTPDEQLVYVIGALLADEEGQIDQDELFAAAQDPDVCALGREILRKAFG